MNFGGTPGAVDTFDTEMLARMLRASLYLLGAQRTANQADALAFADETTDVILDAVRKLEPLGAKIGVSFPYLQAMANELAVRVMANPDALLQVVSQASEAAQRSTRTKESMQ